MKKITRAKGFTLIELLAVMGIIAIIASMAVASFKGMREKARTAIAISDIRNLHKAILQFEVDRERFPYDMNELIPDYMQKVPPDPWGTPYQFYNFSAPQNPQKGDDDDDHHPVTTQKGKGEQRKDGPIVPINTQFDLYSMGPDKKTAPSIRSSPGKDDIVLANDGEFIGVAADY